MLYQLSYLPDKPPVGPNDSGEGNDIRFPPTVKAEPVPSG